MSERYTRLCALPENLYAAGSPVLLSAGALLKDNQAGRVLVQLKLRSLSPENIKAVKVSVRPFDTVGAPLGEAVEHLYLDLTAARGDEFGAKSPIVMPDAATRAFSAVVTEVAFADNTVWHATGAPWEPLPIPQPLDTALEDAELVKQFRMTYGEDCKCLPMEHRDLWYCTCGARNRREEAVCHRCNREHAALAAIDLDALRAARDERLAAEAEKAEQARIAAAARAKKTKKITLITVSALALIAAAVLLTTKVIIPTVKYNAAVDLMEAGQYVDAIAAFEAMDGYKDSAEQITECKYLYAATLLENEQLNDAMILFRALGTYKDSVDQVSECQYRGATNQMQDKNWSTAASMFQNLGTYKDSKEQLAACQKEQYKESYDAAVALMNAGKYGGAYKAFCALGTYGDSAEKAIKILEQNPLICVTAHVGDSTTVTFGAYEQDNNTANGKEKIEWLVLDVQDDKVLLVSKCALDCKPYNTKYSSVTWETCTLRTWLNEDFFNAAFSTEEQGSIPTVRVSADWNPFCSTDPGNATQDKVFLLSTKEEEQYFTALEAAKQCKPTVYAKRRGADVDNSNGNCAWWLRSPGNARTDASIVYYDGSVDKYCIAVAYDAGAIRPAIWVSIGS